MREFGRIYSAEIGVGMDRDGGCRHNVFQEIHVFMATVKYFERNTALCMWKVGLEITARKQPCCFCPAVMEQGREFIAKAISCPSLPSLSSWSPPFSLSQLSHTHKNIPFSSCIGSISRLSLLSEGRVWKNTPALLGMWL